MPRAQRQRTEDAAMEAARKYNEACLHTPCGHICRRCHAAALDTYAAEQCSIKHAGRAILAETERDAALAKLEAAEAERDRIAAESLANIVAWRRADERVRVLEAVLRHEIPWRDYKTKYGTVSIDANGAISIKAAADEGGKDEPASAS